MFGFTSLSEAPFGFSSSASPDVSLGSVSASTAVAGLSVGGFEVDISERLSSVSATGSVGVVTARFTTIIGSVSATGSIGTPIITASSNEILDSVSSTGSIGSTTVNLNVSLVGVEGSGVIAPTVVRVSQTKIVVGVGASGSVGSVDIGNSTTLTGVVALGEVNSLIESVDEVLDSIFATTSVGIVSVNITELLASTASQIVAGQLTATGVTFNFNQNDYSKQRTIYTAAQDKKNTVVITPENRTLFLSKQNNNTQTIKIAA